MLANFRPTLRQVFAFSLLGLLLSLAFLFYLVLDGSQRTLLQSSEHFRDDASREVVRSVTEYLNEAPQAVAHFERLVEHGLVDPKNPGSIQMGLFSLLLANGNFSEASFTYADSTGFAADGTIQLKQSSAGQVTVFRLSIGQQFISVYTRFDGHQFVSRSVALQNSTPEDRLPVEREAPAPDPTAHPTFQTPSRRDVFGRLLWTDLHWSQLDQALPENKRRVEMSVQQAVKNSNGRFAGVVRVGLLKEQIDRIIQLRPAGSMDNDPHLVFLCDNQGRLITGFGNGEHIAESGDDLRVSGGELPPEVAAALQQPALKTIRYDQTMALTFRSGPDTYLCTFRAFPESETQGWIVGIVVPRNYYLGALLPIRRQVLWASLALISAIFAVGVLIVQSIGRAHSLIVHETARMNDFEFSPSAHFSRLRDIGVVLAGLERAKTAMRAMGKYVPVDLVKKLYREGREPALGGEAIELSVLFTDVKDFTSFAEQIPPDKLAEILGRYLGVMAAVIQNEQGIIDKYIGDAVMAFWNAPAPVANHSILACRAALNCRAALRDLYASPEWRDSPQFETRFGLHRCVASVGHFGAPDRFNYTAVGDGINLGSRLEGLNRHYGTTVIVSESIQAAARDYFEFRLLDRVAVQGKMQGIRIYELISERMPGALRPAICDPYEQAFESYQRADFKAALALLQNEVSDPPSRVLASRCQQLDEHPPPAGWNGVHIFDSK